MTKETVEAIRCVVCTANNNCDNCPVFNIGECGGEKRTEEMSIYLHEKMLNHKRSDRYIHLLSTRHPDAYKEILSIGCEVE